MGRLCERHADIDAGKFRDFRFTGFVFFVFRDMFEIFVSF